jgi:zinc/manganese transport system substrate-binding protein
MRSALLLLPLVLLAGCATPPADDDGRVHIVASTNVYGSVASALGGDHVAVTSLIDSAAQDPHSFEASARDQLAISKADLVIENGGGYDPFIDTLLDASSSKAVVISASEASGLLGDDHDDHDHDHDDHDHDDHGAGEEPEGHEGDGHDHIEGFNEHVWYSIHGIEHVSEAISEQLTALDPENAADYAANLDAFVSALGELEASAEALQPQTMGLTVAITEPVPLYLLESAGFDNATPDEFSEAIEEGTDVPPAALADTLGIVRTVALLAYNSQTASPETEQVKAAAEAAGVPVVEFTETLPDGEDYISWMTSNLAAITAALG